MGPESAAEDVSNSIEAIDEASADTAKVPTTELPKAEVCVEKVCNGTTEDVPEAKPADIATLQTVEEVPATSVVEATTAAQVEAQPADNEVHNESNGTTSEKAPVVAVAECAPEAGSAVEEVPARAEPSVEKAESHVCWRPGQGRFRRHLRNASCFGRGK